MSESRPSADSTIDELLRRLALIEPHVSRHDAVTISNARATIETQRITIAGLRQRVVWKHEPKTRT